MNKINIMIIGIGNHARRIYVPSLHKLSKIYPVNFCAGVEVIHRKADVEEYLSAKNIALPMHYVPMFDGQKKMPATVERQLNEIVRMNHIDGVVISTDPLAHKVYAKWALTQGLNILMDKPISTRDHVVSDVKQANGIVSDFRELYDLYEKNQLKKETIFSVNVQRRYELGYQKVFELINEATKKFNVPVTSIQSMHSDGVWIFPDEIVEQTCHPYNRGYGKCSHSGYHLFDIVWQFYLAGKVENKFPDHGETFTSLLQPDGYLSQINQDDYKQYFGEEYAQRFRRNEKELYPLFQKYGEIDSFSLIRLLKEKRNMCNISINLLHNGFSRRAWATPNKDLYKGNGRIKHQSYHIQQGPFQNIQIHNYQMNDKQDHNTSDEFKLGGNNHFDIYVFRNAAMFGEGTKPLTVYSLKDLDVDNKIDDTRLYHELTKEGVIIEFIQYMLGNVSKKDVKSNLPTHEVPVKIMSSIYKSHIYQNIGKNPISTFSIA
jgi:hypothetical protein